MEHSLLETSVQRYHSIRVNALLAGAYATVLLCFLSVILLSDIPEFAQGVIVLILGRFLGYIDQVYSFEFGTTRANKVKDETISTLSTQQQPAANLLHPQSTTPIQGDQK